MNERHKIIARSIPKSEVVADIGCDHGYVSKLILESGLAKKVIIADVSKKCLQKAEKLLQDYIQKGVCESICCNGFGDEIICDCAVIAGMGGEETISILKNAKVLPNTIVLQPMKNCDKVRVYLQSSGYKIVSDKIFTDANKFYDLIVCTKGEDFLTSEEIEFGRDNVKGNNKDFICKLQREEKYLQEILDSKELSKESKDQIQQRLKRIKRYV